MLMILKNIYIYTYVYDIALLMRQYSTASESI